MVPTLIAMKGAPCSGKGEVSEALASHLGVPVLDKDDILEPLLAALGIPPAKEHRDKAQDSARDAVGGASFDAVWAIATRELRAGRSLVADTPLPKPQSYEAAQRAAGAAGARLLVVSTMLAHDEWNRRLIERKRLHPDTHKLAGEGAAERYLAKNPAFEIRSEHDFGSVCTDTRETAAHDVARLLARLTMTALLSRL